MNALLPVLAVLGTMLVGCRRDDQPAASSAAGATLRVHTTQRSGFHVVGGDTLSDSARILGIHPEQDGDALVVLFADPARPVSAGLAIVDRKMEAPQLLWPDSVTNVWWTGPHTLAFTTATGAGIRLVVDIHAAEMQVADTAAGRLVQPPAALAADSTMMARARAFTDSVRVQAGGVAQGSTLVYAVTRLVSTRDGKLAAFHTAARDAGGNLTNPAWYALDPESGTVTPIDQVTGPVAELRAEAGQWSESGSFFYAKGRALLGSRGCTRGSNDPLIAWTAVSRPVGPRLIYYDGTTDRTVAIGAGVHSRKVRAPLGKVAR